LAQASVKKQKKRSEQISRHITRGMKEGSFLVLVGIALFFLITLVSYEAFDPAWSRSNTGRPVQNAGGVVGAWFADIVLYLFGYMAYLIPILVAYSGWIAYRTFEHTLTIDKRYLSFRTIGFVLTLIGGAGLADIHFAVIQGTLPGDAGGVLGELVGGGALRAFNYTGSTLILLILFLFGVPLFTNFSWFTLMDGIGQFVMAMYDRTVDWVYRMGDKWQGKKARAVRKELVEKEVKKVAKRPPPRIEPVIKKIAISEREERERQVPLFDSKTENGLPPLSLLDMPQKNSKGLSNEALEAISRQVELKLADFGIEAVVETVNPGPVITRFEIQPAAGVKSSQIVNLSKDLARALSVASVRVVEVIPGKTTMGLEIPNENRAIISLSEGLRSKDYESSSSPLTLALGSDISGAPAVADLAKMPHLLVAGTTGSGKSVAINAMILSLLYKATPEDVRLIMIDPKMLELSVYEGIPHLLAPVVTDMKDAANALRWSVAEMERRYKLMAALGVRNLAGANRKIKDAIEVGEPIMDPFFTQELAELGVQPDPLEPLPHIVVVVDELADMMMVVGKKVEELIARLAQKARAAGIHLILATQRPSVDVITGLIKANIPTRIAFQVSSKVDSRTILDQSGAENLLGHGDMLYMPPGTSIPTRIHGAFVSDDEVHKVVDNLKKQGEPDYIDEILNGPSEPIPGISGEPSGSDGDEDDPLYDQAVAVVTESRRASISGVQRRLKIGYNRAARLVEEMERQGIVSAMQSNGNREVLAPPPPKD